MDENIKSKKKRNIIIIVSVVSGILVIAAILLIVFLVILPNRDRTQRSIITTSQSENPSFSFSFSIPDFSFSLPNFSFSIPVFSSGSVQSSIPPQCFSRGAVGNIFDFVGNGGPSGYSGNGPENSLTAQINNAQAMTVDNTGCFLYFYDAGNNRIRRVTLNSTPQSIRTVIGNGGSSLSTSIVLNDPLGSNLGIVSALAVSPINGDLYISLITFNVSPTSGQILRYTRDGSSFSIYSGSITTNTSSPNGPISTATYGGISAMAFDPTGNFLYVADSGWIRRINISAGQVTRFAGNGSTTPPVFDTTPSTALGGLSLGSTQYMSCDNSGNIYVCCNASIPAFTRYLISIQNDGSTARRFYTVSGGLTVTNPFVIAINPNNRIYFIANNILRTFVISDPLQVITDQGGNGANTLGSVNVAATSTSLGVGNFITIDNFNNLYIGLGNTNISTNSVIRRVALLL